MNGIMGGWMEGWIDRGTGGWSDKMRIPGDDLPTQQNSVRPADLLTLMSTSFPEVKETLDEESDLLSVCLKKAFPKYCCGPSVRNLTSNSEEAVPSDNRLDSVSRLPN